MAGHISETLSSELKTKLLSKKEELQRAKELLEEQDTYKDPDRTVGNSELQDEAEEDRAHLETELELENVEETLEYVNKALKKFEDGTYGICEECGKDISTERLKANPEALTCVNDAENSE